MKTKDEQNKELAQYIKNLEGKTNSGVKIKLVEHNLKRYQEKLMNKTDEEISNNIEAFSKYRAGRIEEINKMKVQLQKDKPANLTSVINQLTTEIKTIELDSLLLQSRLSSSVKLAQAIEQP